MGDIGLLAVDIGPGSFTGLKIGVATAQALHQATQIPLVGVVSLEAMAMDPQVKDGLVSPAIDARRGEVYTALYRKESGRFDIVVAPRATSLESWSEDLKRGDGPVTMIGPGKPPHPVAVGRLGLKRFLAMGQRGEENVLPLYCRRPV